ncbi:hypothetical protein CW748_17360 [Alteromonadales bacterium alter-6D02]|nr:hypothetical protein CW748_17360 [Alteromonadales bacterium alter-6D02]
MDKDPVVELVPISYVKRTSFNDEAVLGRTVGQLTAFQPGAALFYQASPNQQPVNISDRAFFNADQAVTPYDVKDVEASYDGKFLLFSLRAPNIDGVDDDQQPSWNIWQYEISSQTLTRVIQSDLVAEQGHDTSPYYLPDGRIVFSSTRQAGNKSILLDEGKAQYSALDDNRDQFSSVLHVMANDGSNITQISYHQGHDFDPVVLSNGKIVFSRWEQRGLNSGVSLYQIDSDGKGLELLYGRHSHQQADPDVQFIQPREMPDGKLLVGLRTFEQTNHSFDFVLIDTQHYIDSNQLVDSTQEIESTGNEQGSEVIESAAQAPALFAASPLNGAITLQGQFNRAIPLYDGSERLIIGWSQCRVVDPSDANNLLPCTETLLANPEVQAAPELFGYWLYDRQSNTQTPLVLAEEGIYLQEIVALDDKPYPQSTQTSSLTTELLALEQAKMAIVDIRSVYDFSGQDIASPNLTTLSNPSLTTRDDRPAQFVRIIKAVSIPDDQVLDFNNRAFGRSRAQSMRDILGYAPVEPDGSVRFKMPANMAFSLEILDAAGKRLSSRHESWLQLAPGEERQCNGCHTAQSTLSHGLIGRGIDSINLGAASNGPFTGSNDTISAQMNETMAQARARVMGLNPLSPSLDYVDVWSDSTNREVDNATSLSYDQLLTAAPISDNCRDDWQNHCRISIHFPMHIQPLFDLDRAVLDDDGETLLAQNRCTSCHSTSDDDGLVRVPDAQLDLRADPSTDDTFFTTAYRELLFNDNEQEIVEGILLDKLVEVVDEAGNPVLETDENGEFILDSEGQPIVVMQTVRVRAPLSLAGASRNNDFFALFADGGSHEHRLNQSELRLIAEWLDIGAQYYNDPFAVSTQ